MKKENAINFLLYSYFELTLDSDENEILDAAISRAYRDASSHVLSVTEETNRCKNDNGKEVPLRDASLVLIKEKIKELKETPCDYDDWFFKTCNGIQRKYEEAKNKVGEDSFKFGHAQKWVNMALKYLCVIKSIFNICEKTVLPWLTDELEKQLHVPVDSFIMEAAASKGDITVKKEKRNFEFGLNVDLPNKNGGFGAYSSARAWSKWDEEDYKSFRKKIKDKFGPKAPLDWEGPAWIEIAKIRKEREKN